MSASFDYLKFKKKYSTADNERNSILHSNPFKQCKHQK